MRLPEEKGVKRHGRACRRNMRRNKGKLQKIELRSSIL